MKKKIRKLMAVLLASSMIVQQGSMLTYAEQETELQTSQEAQKARKAESGASAEKATEAPTEKATEKATEAPTEKPTEKATEAPTEKPTEAPTEKAAEKATEAPTEKPTEKATEAPTEKPTEKATEAATEKATEAPTEKPTEKTTEATTEKPSETGTEKQTEALTEKSSEALAEEQTEPQTEAEAEEKEEEQTSAEAVSAAAQEKDGEKLSVSALRNYVAEALPYLVVSENDAGAETAEDEILTGAEAGALLARLEETSLLLANSRSTSGVEVINLYADEKGRIDTEPLKELYGSGRIDVSTSYAVVNIVAADPGQNLDFSGYELVYQNAPVRYEDVTRVGYVLYNFTALQGESFTDYRGTVTLSDGDALLGTYLAPAGAVSVKSDLYGAVWADQAEFQDGVSPVRIVLIDGREAEDVNLLPEETDYDGSVSDNEPTELQSETVDPTIEADQSETPGQTMADSTLGITLQPGTTEQTADGTQTGTPGQTTDGTQTGTPGQTADGTQSGTSGQTTDGTQTGTTDQTADGTQTGTTDQTADGTQTGTTDQTVDGTQSETTGQSESESQAESEGGVIEEQTGQDSGQGWYSENGILMGLLMVDSSSQTPLSGGALRICAAEAIVRNGATVYSKDQEICSAVWNAGETSVQEIGNRITCGGSYYIEVSSVPEGYAAGARIYFTVNSQGEAVFDSTVSEWDQELHRLSFQLHKEEHTDRVTRTVIILNGGDRSLKGASFVVKDSNRQLITDRKGRPKHYVTVSSGKAVLDDLAAGTYYLSQVKAPAGYLAGEDIAFTVTEGESGTVAVTNQAIPQQSNTLSVSAETMYQDMVLTAESDSVSYVTLFLNRELTRKATEVKTLTQKSGSETSDAAVFAGLADGTAYYLAETDEYGTPLGNAEGSATKLSWQVRFVDTAGTSPQTVTSVKFESAGQTGSAGAQAKTVTMQRRYSAYPEDLFSYTASIRLTLRVRDSKNRAKAVTDTFYVTLFRDASCRVKLAKPVKVSLKNKSGTTLSLSFKMTQASAVYYALETDEKGNPLDGGNGNYEFAVGFYDSVTKKEDGSVAVGCGQGGALVVTNTLSSSVVSFSVTDKDGKLLSGAELVIKNAEGKVLSVNKVVKFQSESEATVWTGVLPEGAYYLSEVKAPSGYLPVPDVAFEVESGRTTEVTMTNARASGGRGITAGIQVYGGQHLLYAQDTSSGKYASEGRYTRYAALFADEARTQKVTDVMTVTLSAFTGNVTFGSLESGKTYYVAETDQYGQVLSQTSYGGTISYTGQGKLTLGSSDGQLIIRETYSSLPTGFRYTAKLTLEKRVVDSSGNAKAVTDSFYIGIFRNADYSDTPTVIRMDLNNAASSVVTRRVLLSGENDVTYYIAEVDQNGSLISGVSDFNYTASVDNPQLTLTKSGDVKATVTNQEKVSRVTLYLTKRVYEGSQRKQVTDTFYAGLFKDPEFTQLYANPIALKLEDSSSVTLRLSLNLGNASEATIYVAEVDAEGNVVSSGETFGYDVRMINAAAAFSQEVTEIQTVLLNTVYGTADEDTWNQILDDNADLFENSGTGQSGGYGYYDSFSGNGEYAGTTGAVQTGDTTPWMTYLILLAVSGAVAAQGIGRRLARRRRKG